MKIRLLTGAFGFAACLAAGPITINYTGGMSAYTVPTAGIYQIIGYGAGGGGVSFAAAGGYGAEIGGDFDLSKNQVLNFYIGGVGGTGDFVGGGGGGTFVQSSTGMLLLAAGGGGGGYVTLDANGIESGVNGADASTGTAGGGLYGGSDGNGGVAWFAIAPNGISPPGGGGGGAGYLSVGSPLMSFSSGGGGATFPTLTGGSSGGSRGGAGSGGYGGGGGGYFSGGFTVQGALLGYTGGPGGGGGYSGGGGGAPLYFAGIDDVILAGGGGSYWDPNATNLIVSSTGNLANGYAMIDYLGPSVPPPVEPATATPEPPTVIILFLGLLTFVGIRGFFINNLPCDQN